MVSKNFFVSYTFSLYYLLYTKIQNFLYLNMLISWSFYTKKKSNKKKVEIQKIYKTVL